MHRHLRILLFALLLPGPLPAQSLAQRVNAVGDGTVRLSFPARPGTCGDGTNGVTVRQVSDAWQPDCNPRLVRVALGLSERRIQSVRTYVGGQWLPNVEATDLGIVRPHEAAAYFIDLARRDAETGLAALRTRGSRLSFGSPVPMRIPSSERPPCSGWAKVRILAPSICSKRFSGRELHYPFQLPSPAQVQNFGSIACHREATCEEHGHPAGTPVCIRQKRPSPHFHRGALPE